ncbi:MAG: pyrimidine/purine nucleoside phosphorylase [Syntrophales bacterium]|nr:pyrimidine/purine nucleoside phosphorylase [Syntrophales bacterium]
MMTGKIPERFDDVSVICKANVYHEGRVASHTVLFKDGSRKTLGVIHPGSYNFKTDDPEKMDITAGNCRVRQADEGQWERYQAGAFFIVPGRSSFDIVVDEGIVQYICSFEPNSDKE